jgi:hypothetical protein
VATARTLRDSAGAEHPLCPWFPSRRRPIGSGPSAEHARREAARRAATILAYGPLTDGDLLRRGRAVALRLPYDGLQEGQPDWFAFAYAFPHPDEDDGPCP